MYIDSHVHSDISFDGEATIADFVSAGKEKGLDGIVFTEHYDIFDGMDPRDDKAKPFDVCEYQEKLWSIRDSYKGYVKAGVEIGLRPDTKEAVQIASKLFDYDFVIGSSHIVCGVNVSHDDSFYSNLSKQEAYERYLEEVCDNIKLYGQYFDVYGHLDYIARYGNYSDKIMHYKEFSSLIDKVLKLLIENDCGIEVNTAGYRQSFSSPHPTLDVIKRYKELGGSIITLGSDAHQPKVLGHRFDDAINLVREAGFDKICLFNKRQAEYVHI